MAVRRFNLDATSQVVEIASNDGYLLQYFAEKNIPVLGVEPAANVAQVAAKKGISSITKFFSRETAKERDGNQSALCHRRSERLRRSARG